MTDTAKTELLATLFRQIGASNPDGVDSLVDDFKKLVVEKHPTYVALLAAIENDLGGDDTAERKIKVAAAAEKVKTELIEEIKRTASAPKSITDMTIAGVLNEMISFMYKLFAFIPSLTASADPKAALASFLRDGHNLVIAGIWVLVIVFLFSVL